MLNTRSRAFNILFVYPSFISKSFWNYKATCEIVGAKYPTAPLGLITVAALLPGHWNLRLVNRNTETLTNEDIDWADVVFTGGMMAQQLDTLRTIDLCHARGKRVAVGGPDASSSPHVYDEADFKFVGEAEGVIDQLVAAIERGDERGEFTAEKFKADVTSSPIPRFDLLKFRQYLHIGVQFSRGCPFTCEFCDIIELYGRVPRAKTNAQMLAELDELYRLGYRGHVDFVDDNLIGNKKAVKKFLPELAAWQKAHGYPFEFSTEASLNISDDDELLNMMRQANFFALFVGIETPDPETLVATSKKQNTRRDITESVRKIYSAGIFVTAGFIVGFDGEKGSVAKQITTFIERAAIPVCMVGLLFALPNTQLTRRLEKEGRLHVNHDVVVSMEDGDQCTLGLNFETKRPREDILRDCLSIVRTIYGPEAYFARVRDVCLSLDCTGQKQAKAGAKEVKDLLSILWHLTRRWQFAPHFWTTAWRVARSNPAAIPSLIKLSALYLHFGPFSRHVASTLENHIAAQVSQWQRFAPLRQQTASAGVPGLAASDA
jgi:radical SAM superfamily enzyme YgiQ (UPF0313 family)